MNRPILNNPTRTFLIDVLVINAVIWIAGYSIYHIATWKGLALEIEMGQYPWKVGFLILSGIIFLVQATLLFKGRGRHFLFPVLGILLALIYCAIRFYFIVILDSLFVRDQFVIFGEVALLGLLLVRLVLLIKNRF